MIASLASIFTGADYADGSAVCSTSSVVAADGSVASSAVASKAGAEERLSIF